MGLFGFPKREDVNEGVKKFHDTPGAVLLDVRTQNEYARGHIPGSINVDVYLIGRVKEAVPDKDTPVFVYCQSGVRSAEAVKAMKEMGYTNAVSIGGIGSYRGSIEK